MENLKFQPFKANDNDGEFQSRIFHQREIRWCTKGVQNIKRSTHNLQKASGSAKKEEKQTVVDEVSKLKIDGIDGELNDQQK